MTHEQARLRNNSALGQTGGIVTIDSVNALFSDSASANSAAVFQCADCGVRVHAVIPAQSKAGRKRSPSSYFSSSPLKHQPGCTRRATPMSSGQKASKVIPAAPNKAPAPSVWRPSTVTGGPQPGGSASALVKSSAPSGASISSNSGAQTSKRTSTLVEVFARHWLTLSAASRRAATLQAPWNLGSTYDSAFFDLSVANPVESPQTATHIFVGTVESIKRGSTGYIVVLTERHGLAGHPMWVWIKDDVRASRATGTALWRRLATSGVLRGSVVFALGAFTFTKRNGFEWYSLPISDAADVWIA